MNVFKLRDKLNQLIIEGDGNKIVYTYSEYTSDQEDTIDFVEKREDGKIFIW